MTIEDLLDQVKTARLDIDIAKKRIEILLREVERAVTNPDYPYTLSTVAKGAILKLMINDINQARDCIETADKAVESVSRDLETFSKMVNDGS